MEQSSDLKLKRIGNYTITGKTLGKGHFARVEEAYHTILKAKVAIKIISTREITDEYVLKHYKREAEIMSKISHPNIIYLFETIETSKHYYIITEIGSGGDLCNFVKSQRYGKLDEKRARPLAKQLVSAVGYLHQIEIVHRDLKMENILLDNSKEKIKLVDFGLSNFCKHSELLNTHCGSPEYAAPELYISDRKYGPEVDIWSIGIIIYGMLVGKLPFYKYIQKPTDNNEKKNPMYESQIGLTMKHHKILMEFSHSVRILITKILKPDPCKRITMKELCKNVWISCFDTKGYPMEDSSWKNNVISKISNYLNQPAPEVYKKILNLPYGPLGGIYNIGRFFHINRKLYGYPCKCGHMKKKICDCFYRTKMSSKITSKTQSLELITQMQTTSSKNAFLTNRCYLVKYKNHEEFQPNNNNHNNNHKTNLLEKSLNIQNSQDNNQYNDVDYNILNKKNNENNKNDNVNNNKESHNSSKPINSNENYSTLNSASSSKKSKKSNIIFTTNNLPTKNENDNCNLNDKNSSTINSPSLLTPTIQNNSKTSNNNMHQESNIEQNDAIVKQKTFVKENVKICSINNAINNTNIITTNSNITTSTIITETITAIPDRTAFNLEKINKRLNYEDKNIINDDNVNDLINDEVRNKNFQNNIVNVKPKKSSDESISVQKQEKEINHHHHEHHYHHVQPLKTNDNNDNGIDNKSKNIKKSSKLTSIKMFNYLNEKFSQAFGGIYSSTNKNKLTNSVLNDNNTNDHIQKNDDKDKNKYKGNDNDKNVNVGNDKNNNDNLGRNDKNESDDKNYNNNKYDKSDVTTRSNHSISRDYNYKKIKTIHDNHSHRHHLPTKKIKSFQKSTKQQQKQSKNSLGITALAAISNLKKFSTFNTRETTTPTFSNIKNIHYSNFIYFNKNRNTEIMKIYENNRHASSYDNGFISCLSLTNSNDSTTIKTIYKNDSHINNSIPEIPKHNCNKINNNNSNIVKKDNEKKVNQNNSISKSNLINGKRKKTKSTTHTLKKIYNSNKNHFNLFKKQNLPAEGIPDNDTILHSIATVKKSTDNWNKIKSSNCNGIKNPSTVTDTLNLKNFNKLNKCDKKQTIIQNKGYIITNEEYNKNKNEMYKIRRNDHKTATINAYKCKNLYKIPELNNEKLIKNQNKNNNNDNYVSIDNDDDDDNKNLLNQKIKNSIKMATRINKLINNNVDNSKNKLSYI